MTTAEYCSLYPDAIVIKYDDIGSLFNILRLDRSYSQIILIGHGSDQGILSAKQGIIPWKNIADWINTLPSTQVYFLSCDSLAVTKLVNKPSVGFQGVIDGPLAAYAIAIKDNQYHHVNLNTNNAILQFVTRYDALLNGAKEELMMICYSPSTQLSSQISTTDCGTPPPPQPKTIPASVIGSCTLQPSDPLYNLNPEYVVFCAGIVEVGFWLTSILALSLLLYFDLYLNTEWSISEKVGLSLAAMHAPLIYTLYEFGQGQISIGAVFDQITMFTIDGLSLLYNAWLSADLATQLVLAAAGFAAIVTLAIEYGTDFASASGAITLAKWIGAAASVLGISYGVITDVTDTNLDPD